MELEGEGLSDSSWSFSLGTIGAIIFGLISWALWGFATGAIIFLLCIITWDFLVLIGYIPVLGEILYFFAYRWVESQLLPLVHFHAGGWTTGLIFWFGMLSCLFCSLITLGVLAWLADN